METRRELGTVYKNDLVRSIRDICSISFRGRFVYGYKTGAPGLQPRSPEWGHMSIEPLNSILSDSESTTEQPKILVLDDDPVFRSLVTSLGQHRNLDVEAYESFQEVDWSRKINSYSGVIIDYHLVGADASDVIKGLESFFIDIPLLLVSVDDRAQDVLGLNSAFRQFVSKSEGSVKILETLERLLNQQKSRRFGR